MFLGSFFCLDDYQFLRHHYGMNQNILDTKIGILGGGQLGRMLCLAGASWNLDISVLDSTDCPASGLCKNFVVGDINDYNNVLSFGRTVDVLTIEIEHVNIRALKELELEGVKVSPKPATLEIIKDKKLQKQFYKDNAIASSNFSFYESKSKLLEDVNLDDTKDSPKGSNSKLSFPFVQKACKGGYDGKGVVVIKDKNDLDNLLDCECIVEGMVDIAKELSVIIARNESGQIQAYPVCEMEFDPQSNLVQFLFTPANINTEIESECQKIALDIVNKMDYVGILAVELFLTKEGKILVNEIAPRTHNSGHHTIEGSVTSQFEQQLRAILNLPLGSTEFLKFTGMVNLVGEDGYEGEVKIEGLDKCLAIPEFHLHLYGKTTSKPNRKMGHATILADNFDEMQQKANTVIRELKIISE